MQTHLNTQQQFSSLVSLTIDLNQTVLGSAIQDIYSRLNSLTQQTSTLEKKSHEQLMTLEEKLAHLDLELQESKSNIGTQIDVLRQAYQRRKNGSTSPKPKKRNHRQSAVDFIDAASETQYADLTKRKVESNLEVGEGQSNYMSESEMGDEERLRILIEEAISREFENRYQPFILRVQEELRLDINRVNTNVGGIRNDMKTQKRGKTQNFKCKKSLQTTKQDRFATQLHKTQSQQERTSGQATPDQHQQHPQKQEDPAEENEGRMYRTNSSADNMEEYLEQFYNDIMEKLNLYVSTTEFEQLKTELFAKIGSDKDLMYKRIQETSKTSSVITDHILALKTKIEQVKSKESENRIDCKSLNEKTIGFESQLFLLKEAVKSSKQVVGDLQKKLTRYQLRNSNQSGDDVKENEEQEKNSPRKGNLPRNSSSSNANGKRDSGRLSILNPNMLNGETTLEEFVRRLGTKVMSLTERLNKMEDEKKHGMRQSKSGLLPKIEGSRSSTPSFDIVKLELKKLNDQLLKTNQRLETTKFKLNQLNDAHNLLPLQIQDLYIKLRQHHEFQQDRLLELIKELINRCLTDPFNNNFTNTLKREINIKFLEIKHEYYGILKEIENKVEDRAEQKEVSKLRVSLDEGLLEVKTLISKKSDNEDFKKGIKYLENKVKQLYGYVKGQVAFNAEKNDSRGFINIRKNH